MLVGETARYRVQNILSPEVNPPRHIFVVLYDPTIGPSSSSTLPSTVCMYSVFRTPSIKGLGQGIFIFMAVIFIIAAVAAGASVFFLFFFVFFRTSLASPVCHGN